MKPAPPVFDSATRPRLRRRSLLTHTAITAGLLLSSLVVSTIWADSYLFCRQIPWGDRYRGAYTFIHFSFGAVFLEQRTNSDISERGSWNRVRGYDYTPKGPNVRRRGTLGFEYFEGTHYCWYANLYPTASLPSLNDPRWQK